MEKYALHDELYRLYRKYKSNTEIAQKALERWAEENGIKIHDDEYDYFLRTVIDAIN